MTEQAFTQTLAFVRHEATEQRRWNEYAHGTERTWQRAELLALAILKG